MTKEEAKEVIYDKVFDFCGNKETDIITETVNNCIDKIDEPFWHTEEPKEDGEYLIKVNGVHLVCFFSTLRKKKEFSYWSYYNDREQYYSLGEVQGWHKIPDDEESSATARNS